MANVSVAVEGVDIDFDFELGVGMPVGVPGKLELGRFLELVAMLDEDDDDIAGFLNDIELLVLVAPGLINCNCELETEFELTALVVNELKFAGRDIRLDLGLVVVVVPTPSAVCEVVTFLVAPIDEKLTVRLFTFLLVLVAK